VTSAVTRTVTLFTREHCHLCAVAHDVIERVQQRSPFALEIVDLDREASDAKRSAYDHEVPVVELDGRKIMKYRVDPVRLRRLLEL